MGAARPSWYARVVRRSNTVSGGKVTSQGLRSLRNRCDSLKRRCPRTHGRLSMLDFGRLLYWLGGSPTRMICDCDSFALMLCCTALYCTVLKRTSRCGPAGMGGTQRFPSWENNLSASQQHQTIRDRSPQPHPLLVLVHVAVLIDCPPPLSNLAVRDAAWDRPALLLMCDTRIQGRGGVQSGPTVPLAEVRRSSRAFASAVHLLILCYRSCRPATFLGTSAGLTGCRAPVVFKFIFLRTRSTFGRCPSSIARPCEGFSAEPFASLFLRRVGFREGRGFLFAFATFDLSKCLWSCRPNSARERRSAFASHFVVILFCVRCR